MVATVRSEDFLEQPGQALDVRNAIAVGLECRIIGDVGTIETLDAHSPKQGIVAAGQEDRTRLGLVGVARRGLRRAVAVATKILAADQSGGAVQGQNRHRDVDQRNLDSLATAKPVARDHGGEDCAGRGHRGSGVDDRHGRSHRHSAAFAGQGHEPARGLKHRIVAAPGDRSRFVAPVARNRAIDQSRIVFRDAVIVEAEPFHDSIGKIFDDDVGARDELERDFPPRIGFEIERDAALVAIGAEIKGALSTAGGGHVMTTVITLDRHLDLDDLGAEVGELLRAVGPGEHLREIDHAQTLERGRDIGRAAIGGHCIPSSKIMRLTSARLQI